MAGQKTGDAQTSGATSEPALTAEQMVEQLGADADPGSETQPETTEPVGDEESGADELQPADEGTEAEPDDDTPADEEGDGEKAEATEDADEPKKPSRGDKRFAELSAKLHAKDEALVAKDAEIATLKQKADAVDASAVAGLALPLDYVSTEEVTLIREANAAQEREMFLNEALARIDSEDVADPKTGKPLTKLEIARELNSFIPRRGQFARAQALYAERKAQFVADAAAGRAARLAKAKAPAVKPGAVKTAPPPVKPKVAVAPPAAASSKPVASGPKKPGMTTAQFDRLKSQFGETQAAAMALAEM